MTDRPKPKLTKITIFLLSQNRYWNRKKTPVFASTKSAELGKNQNRNDFLFVSADTEINTKFELFASVQNRFEVMDDSG